MRNVCPVCGSETSECPDCGAEYEIDATASCQRCPCPVVDCSGCRLTIDNELEGVRKAANDDT
jgi:hypothetical protein